MNNLFFELLQVAIGHREALSQCPTKAQWQELMAVSKRQALQGIAFQGVQRLPREQWPSGDIVMAWMGQAEQIRRRNIVATAVCQRLTATLEADGFDACILKGQANHTYYEAALANHRTCGDIDVWVRPKRTLPHPIHHTLSYLDQTFGIESLCWLHAELKPVDIVPVEAHLHPSFLNTPWSNRRFLSMFEQENCTVEAVVDGGVTLRKLRTDYDLIFQLNHVYRHLLDEGVGLRQVLDYCMLLKAYREGTGLMGRDELQRRIDRCGMMRFAKALMWVLHKVFALPSDALLCEPSESEGRFLLDEIMLAGNFGQYDVRMQRLEVRRGKLSYQLRRAQRRFVRNVRFVRSYPAEVAFEPVARLWHYLWKRMRIYKRQ